MKRLFFLLIPAVALASTACAPVTPYAAIVNGKTISSEVITTEINDIVGNVEYSQLLDQELSAGSGAGGLQPDGKNTVNSTYTAQLVYNRVLVELINQEIAKQHLNVTDEQRSNADTAVRSDFNNDKLFDSLPKTYQTYLIDRQAKLNAILDQRNTPAKQQQYYNDHIADFQTYCIRHILVQTETQANDIYSQLQNGGDFATLAKADSIDTGSGPQGGDLGCEPATQISQFVPEFAQAVLAATPNQVTKPVQSQYGYHLIEVTSKTQQSFADSSATISQTLGSSQAFFTDVLASAKVKVNPRYGDYVASDTATNSVGHIIPHPAATVAAAATSTEPSGLGDTSESVPDTSETVPAQ